ncbi:hypothetical protein LSAT2_013007 [Lamellibrachia satsuma]|nr:hypothetical protein LSAT2_013007 [Lamellibrachia satsuma]
MITLLVGVICNRERLYLGLRAAYAGCAEQSGWDRRTLHHYRGRYASRRYAFVQILQLDGLTHALNTGPVGGL